MIENRLALGHKAASRLPEDLRRQQTSTTPAKRLTDTAIEQYTMDAFTGQWLARWISLSLSDFCYKLTIIALHEEPSSGCSTNRDQIISGFVTDAGK